MQTDAGASRLQRGPRALEHVDLAPEVAQHEGRGEASDGAADDSDVWQRDH